MKSTTRLLLITVACMVSVGFSNTLNKGILGRWYVIQGDFDLFEFFSDGAFLAKNATLQHSGKWSVIDDNRIKAEVTVLGTTLILLFEKINISGDTMALTLNGKRCELSRNAPTSDDGKAMADFAQDMSDLKNAVKSGQLSEEQAKQRFRTLVQKLPPQKRRLIQEETAQRNAQNFATIASSVREAGYTKQWRTKENAIQELRTGISWKTGSSSMGPFKVEIDADEIEEAAKHLQLRGDSLIYVP